MSTPPITNLEGRPVRLRQLDPLSSPEILLDLEIDGSSAEITADGMADPGQTGTARRFESKGQKAVLRRAGRPGAGLAAGVPALAGPCPRDANVLGQPRLLADAGRGALSGAGSGAGARVPGRALTPLEDRPVDACGHPVESDQEGRAGCAGLAAGVSPAVPWSWSSRAASCTPTAYPLRLSTVRRPATRAVTCGCTSPACRFWPPT